MKKSFLLLVMACFWLAGSFAQTGAIVNLEVAQRTDGSGLVDIHFDLNGAGASYNLQFEASFDDGVNYEPLSETFLTGELANVLPGAGKHLIWAGKASHPETFSTQTRVRVIAIEKTTFECGDSFVDQRDGKSYATVQIGEQCWMAENLAWLPSVSPSNQGSQSNPFYYVYGYQGSNVSEAKAASNYQIYGTLYNWPASMNACPEGWHLPMDGEWTGLTDYVSSQPEYFCDNNATYIAKALAAKTNWNTNANTCAVGNNLSANNAAGFTALPGGDRYAGWSFGSQSNGGYWWSSSQCNPSSAWSLNLFVYFEGVYRDCRDKSDGFSIRCLKDDVLPTNQPPSPPSNPSPETGSINQTITPTLTWDCSDPEGDPLTYDVYLGTEQTPPLAVSGIIEQTYTPETLQYSTTYYWKIVAHDDEGNSTVGEVWSFTIGNAIGDGLPCPGTPTVADIDGNVYNTVQIGNQCWIKENLKTTKDANGNNITRYCFDNNTDYCNWYGGLYYWETAMNGAASSNNNPSGVQGICPAGWHVPSDPEWTQLVDYVIAQGYPNDSNNPQGAGNALKSCRQINSPLGGDCNTIDQPRWESNSTHYGFDEFGFSALPGDAGYWGRSPRSLGTYGHWWSATEYSTTIAWTRAMGFSFGHVGRDASYSKMGGISVRCIKDFGSATNQPPLPPFNPSPETGAINQTITPTLTWDCTDPEGDPLTYDVYFGTDENPPLAVSGISEQSYSPAALECSTIYNWKIAAHDDQGNTTEGEVWTFITGNANGDGQPCPGMPTVSDIDGNVYNTVQIGDQCWMAENLNIGTMINGASNQTNNGIIEKYCYDNSEANCDVYGGLYQWSEMMQYTTTEGVQGICPDGWHLPSDADWCALEQAVDPTISCSIEEWRGENGGGNLKETGTSHWMIPNTGATNSSGFTSLPGGYRDHFGPFLYMSYTCLWWSSSQSGASISWYRILDYNKTQICRTNNSQFYGFSVRCLKDDVMPTNLPPFPPSNPSPETGAINQTITPTLTWTCSDPEGDPLTYDVYFGTDATPPLVVAGISSQTYTTETLQYSATYYWKIVAYDDHENSTEGEVWSFATLPQPEWQCGDDLIDERDGEIYPTVQIGDQCWIAENLKTTKYRNGVDIAYPGTNITAWQNNTTGAYAWYNNDIAYKNTYGALYNWYTVENSAGLCPFGWHVPSDDAEWTALISYVSSQPVYLCNGNTNYIAKALAANTGWNIATCMCCIGNNLNSNDAANFSGLPGGYRYADGTFNMIGTYGNWWSFSAYSQFNAWARILYYQDVSPLHNWSPKGCGFSVRCIRD